MLQCSITLAPIARVKTASKSAILLQSKFNFSNFQQLLLKLIDLPPSSATSVQGNFTFSEGKPANIHY